MKKRIDRSIGILIIGLAAAACRAQPRLMLTTVANFNDTNSGGNDLPAVIQGKDGMLYGFTQHGGPFDFGTVFRSTLSGSVTTLASFNGTNGMYPEAALIQAPDGNFYGTTIWGGDYDDGTIYRMDTNGVLTTLFSFYGTNGEVPDSALIIGSDGALYGVTQAGGQNFTNPNRGDGTIFKITTNGEFTSLASFNGTNGSEPLDIIQASDGNFYGTAVYGDIDSNNSDFGIVFQMTPDRQINTFVQFDGTNGWGPIAIIEASDGCLYGTAANGGVFYTGPDYPQNSGYGTVFKVTTNGVFTLLASFDGTNGASPDAPLLEVCNGVFYGTAQYGGVYSNGAGIYSTEGTLFQVTTSGDLTALLSFGGHSETVLPSSPVNLIKATDDNYYGGSRGPNQGSVFCIRPVQAPVLQASGQGNQLNLNWNAWAGYSYEVMYETNLTGSNWNLLSTISPQTNGITSYSDPIGPDTQRFYRVVLQLP